MDETYRNLGREREAELERDAVKWRRAAEVRTEPRVETASPNNDGQRRSAHPILARVTALVGWPTRVRTTGRP